MQTTDEIPLSTTAERQAVAASAGSATDAPIHDALDAERIAVRKGFGYGGPHFPLAHHYASEGEQWMYGRGSHDRLTDSGDWRERIVLTEHRQFDTGRDHRDLEVVPPCVSMVATRPRRTPVAV